MRTFSQKFNAYRRIIDGELYEEIIKLAQSLNGVRVLHVNSTATRGGPPEMLRSEIPLLRDLGLLAKWQVFDVPADIYAISKYLHNGLQGDKRLLTASRWQRYEAFSKKLTKYIQADQWDVIVIHDPQPAAILSFMDSKGSAKWIWRCHVDMTQPNQRYFKRFRRYWQPYDGVIFQSKSFVPSNFIIPRVMVSSAAIDPLSPKNANMSKAEADKTLKIYGIDTKRPLITQFSRFDPWKDFPGVIAAWQLAKQVVPDLQLVLGGIVSANDVQGRAILREVNKLIKGLPDVFLFVNEITGRGTKAFHVASDIILQKSIREGFGMTVSEALWSGTPVIGGDVGGIRLQIKNGQNGYLVNSIQECADCIIQLTQNRQLAAEMGLYGREYVRKNFLLPRLMRDEMQFMLQLLKD